MTAAPTIVCADTHLHAYPCHGAALLLGALEANLAALAPDTPGAARCLAGFLAEGRTERFYRRVADKGSLTAGAYTLAPAPEAGALVATRDGAARLILLAGRQIVAAERVEWLALATEAEIPDGLPARETLERIRAAGGVPVLAWAPGKWWFARGRLVRSLIETPGAGPLLLGDSALRPLGWGEPRLLRLGRECGLRVVAGSDPLPFPGEERRAGAYGIACALPYDPARPVTCLRRMLTDPDAAALEIRGRRPAPVEWARRMRRHAALRREEVP